MAVRFNRWFSLFSRTEGLGNTSSDYVSWASLLMPRSFLTAGPKPIVVFPKRLRILSMSCSIFSPTSALKKKRKINFTYEDYFSVFL